MFFASVLSVILAKGLSAPQHSTYLVILDGDRFLSPAWSAFSAAFELEELHVPSSVFIFCNAINHKETELRAVLPPDTELSKAHL
jgi:hypothetical protein